MKKCIILAGALLLSVGLCMISMKDSHAAEKTSFAIIFSGGPDAGTEGKNLITQFISTISDLAKMKKDSVDGQYFNNSNEAIKYIKVNKNCFIMGSLGFYLSNRTALKLAPLTTVKLQGNDKEQFYVLVKTGKVKALKDLKGKKLTGSVLYENKRFINTMIFNNKLKAETHFVLEPSQRPLTAVKKVASGRSDAVLLNHMQLESLKKLAEFKQLQIIYKSEKMPALGFMMVNTPTNKANREKIIKAVSGMCGTADGKSVCKSFGIDGFDAISAESLKGEIAKFDAEK